MLPNSLVIAALDNQDGSLVEYVRQRMSAKNRKNPSKDFANLLKNKLSVAGLHEGDSRPRLSRKGTKDGGAVGRDHDGEVEVICERHQKRNETALQVGMEMDVWLVHKEEVFLFGIEVL